jgi:hypothetical protein
LRCFQKKQATVKIQMASQSPATAPSSATIMGVFGNRLFEPKGLLGEFPIAAHNGEQHRKQAAGGVFFFGYFLLDKQKKVTRQSRESDPLNN